jgi:hypothetical protein
VHDLDPALDAAMAVVPGAHTDWWRDLVTRIVRAAAPVILEETNDRRTDDRRTDDRRTDG